MSARTSAREVVPFGVLTIVVCSHSGALSGTRFWKNELPSAPLGKRCISVGRPPAARRSGSATARSYRTRSSFVSPRSAKKTLSGLVTATRRPATSSSCSLATERERYPGAARPADEAGQKKGRDQVVPALAPGVRRVRQPPRQLGNPHNALVGLEFRLLGPLEVAVESEPVRLGGPKERALLALLVLEAGELLPPQLPGGGGWQGARGGPD